MQINFTPHPTYIIDRRPLEYGSNQRQYEERVVNVISGQLQKFNGSCKDEKGLTALFYSLLEDFRKERNSIAQSTSTPNGEVFGIFRHQGPDIISHISLNHAYQEYAPFALQVLLKDRFTDSKCVTVEDNVFAGCRFKFTTEILSPACLNSQKWNKPPQFDEYPVRLPKSYINQWSNRLQPKLPKLPEWLDLLSSKMQGENDKGKQPIEEDEIIENVLTMLKDDVEKNKPINNIGNQELIDVYSTLKAKHPTFYTRFRMATAIGAFSREFPCTAHSYFIMGTLRLQVKDKLYAMSKYLISSEGPPKLQSLRSSTVKILHQDPFLIDDSLEAISGIFVNAMTAKETHILQIQVGLFRYYFAHVMPFFRGSAAIAEWFEMFIYKSHGLSIAYNRNMSIDLEAFVIPSLATFIDKYCSSMVKIF